MKKCNRCGAENNDESNFYPNCGARLNGPKPNHSHDKNLIERFMDVNIILKWIIIIIAVFVFLVASVCIRYIFFGIPLESYTEGDATYRQFDSLDIVEYGSCGYTVYQC